MFAVVHSSHDVVHGCRLSRSLRAKVGKRGAEQIYEGPLPLDLVPGPKAAEEQSEGSGISEHDMST